MHTKNMYNNDDFEIQFFVLHTCHTLTWCLAMINYNV